MGKARPEDQGEQGNRPPRGMGKDETAEFLEKLDELERDAASRLDPAPIDSVRPPMDMPEVLREKPAAGHMPHAGRSFQNPDSNALAKVWAIGLDFGMMVLAGGLLGWGADYLFQWKPWGILTGLIMGLLVGFVRFIREGLAANRRVISEIKRRSR
jgi:F0F1-type ATP synthase assembly protein I